MQTLQGQKVHLRALEAADLEFLYSIENDMSLWEVSNSQTPYSKYVLVKYLENAQQDIYEAKQLRLVIVENGTNKSVGFIDLFDFNPQHKRAGIGIMIVENAQQNGYASEALSLLIDYCFSLLELHQLFANITRDNAKSLGLFKKHQFKKVGIKKDWILSDGHYKDEVIFQLIKNAS